MISELLNLWFRSTLPVFLCLYAAVAVSMLAVAGLVIWLSDTTRDEDLPPDVELDPYEIAYLRGGVAHVARLAVYDLVERGLVQTARVRTGFFRSDCVLRHSPSVPDATWTPLHRATWSWFSSPRRLSALRDRRCELHALLGPQCEPLHRELAAARLLETRGRAAVRRFVAFILFAGLITLGTARLVHDVATTGQTSGGPVPVLLAAVIATRIACRPTWRSDLGVRLLERMEAALGESRDRTGDESSDMPDSELIRFAVFGRDAREIPCQAA